MTREQFDRFVAAVKARGFTHVRSGGELVPLAEWRPYGAFDGCNPGIEEHIGGFEWLGATSVADYPPLSERPVTGVCGVWTFERVDGEALLDERYRLTPKGEALLADFEGRKRRRRNASRKARDQVLRDLGLTKVRGANGGTYWE